MELERKHKFYELGFICYASKTALEYVKNKVIELFQNVLRPEDLNSLY